MEEWLSTIDRFQDLRVLVVGDVMIDAYLWGKVNRISPEAPVPVVEVERKENRLGGAANVALNISSLGGVPVMLSVVGDDESGYEVKKLLEKRALSDRGILQSSVRPTTVKTRVIAGGQQMLRVDEERTADLSAREARLLLDRCEEILSDGDIKAVVLEDYNKGVLTPAVIRGIMALCEKHGLPVTVDPKKKNFLKYKGATLFKPNLKELSEGIKTEVDPASDESVIGAIDKLQEHIAAETVLVTLSEHGVFCRNQSYTGRVSAHRREIADVSGAGDTVIAVATLCLAAGCGWRELTELANLAGGLVCEEVGVVPLDPQKLRREAKKLATTAHE